MSNPVSGNVLFNENPNFASGCGAGAQLLVAFRYVAHWLNLPSVTSCPPCVADYRTD